MLYNISFGIILSFIFQIMQGERERLRVKENDNALRNVLLGVV